MISDKSFADLERQVLTTCGTNEMVVSNPATKPIIFVESIMSFLKTNHLTYLRITLYYENQHT